MRVDEIIWQIRKELKGIHDNYRININFSDNIDDEKKLTVLGNGQLLISALGNIIENGCKYSGDHTSEVTLQSENKNLAINVKDTGIGIPEKELGTIFQPFSRASNVSGIKGHGIGLCLAERIISLHKGSISVRSEIRKGSTFKVYLPLLTD